MDAVLFLLVSGRCMLRPGGTWLPVELQFQCMHWVGGWDSQVMVQAFIVVGRGLDSCNLQIPP